MLDGRVAVSVILALAAASGCAASEQPDAAARRLDLLEALPFDAVRVPGATFTGEGWDIPRPCHTDSSGRHTILFTFGVACQGLPVQGRFTVAERPPALPEDANAHLSVSVPYPGTGSTRLPPPPQGDDLSICDDETHP